MATVSEIPLIASPQKFSITLGGIQYQLTTKYHPTMGWILDIADTTGNRIVSGIPLVTGTDLFTQLSYLGIAGGAKLQVQSDFNPDAVPTFSNLGTNSHLYLISP